MTTPIQVRDILPEELKELQALFRQTKSVRIRERTQIILLAAEQGLTAPEISAIVRRNDQTARNWIRRFNAEGIAGLYERRGLGHRPR